MAAVSVAVAAVGIVDVAVVAVVDIVVAVAVAVVGIAEAAAVVCCLLVFVRCYYRVFHQPLFFFCNKTMNGLVECAFCLYPGCTCFGPLPPSHRAIHEKKKDSVAVARSLLHPGQ